MQVPELDYKPLKLNIPFRGSIFVSWVVILHDGPTRREKIVDNGLELGKPVGFDLRDTINDDDVVYSVGFGRTLPQKISQQFCKSKTFIKFTIN